jgi:hypothetical protein
MAYTTINKGTDHFNTILYTGDGASSSARTGVGFEPSLIWIKSRSNTDNHNWIDQTRGGSKVIVSNSTDNEEPTASNKILSFDSDGFTTGTHTPINRNNGTHVAWCWKASGQGSVNSDGTINSTYTSANQTSGFSIVSYNGNGTAGATVGHGLSSAPEFIIIKNLSDDSSAWIAYHHKNLTSNPETVYVEFSANTNTVDDTHFNDTAPTNSVFSLGTKNTVNGSGDRMIAYCFHSVKGFSKCGVYEGNGNVDGAFVYTGFKPAMVIVKNIDATQNWRIFDNKRDPSNDNETNILYPNLTNIESTSDNDIDILSNGFKMRTTSAATNNNTCIYYAVAEAPIVGTNNVPANAR